MKPTHEHGSSQTVGAGAARSAGFRLLPSFVRRLFAAGLMLSCASMANAALIEIPRAQSDRGHANGGQLSSWQDSAHHARLNAYGVLAPTAIVLGRAAAYPAIGAARAGDINAHVLLAANGSPRPDSDLYAAIEAPYGSVDAAMPSTSDSDPELWTILLVAAGLIGYQIRRKSRIAAIRIRPLQSEWQRPAG